MNTVSNAASRTADAVAETAGRPRGRPRRLIDSEQLLGVVEGLLRDDGIAGVSIERAAAELGVSRATLYRSVPSREHLLAMLLRRMTGQLTTQALAATAEDGRSARERLHTLVRLHVHAAITMRDYLFLFSGRDWPSPEVYEEWRHWSRGFEQIWVRAIAAASAEESLAVRDPRVAARLLLGMLVWISRWWRPGQADEEEIAAEAIRLIGGDPS